MHYLVEVRKLVTKTETKIEHILKAEIQRGYNFIGSQNILGIIKLSVIPYFKMCLYY